VICSASVEERVPLSSRIRRRDGLLLNTVCFQVNPDEDDEGICHGKVGGRTHEIQRLIGRTLRAVIDLESLGERTVWVDWM